MHMKVVVTGTQTRARMLLKVDIWPASGMFVSCPMSFYLFLFVFIYLLFFAAFKLTSLGMLTRMGASGM